MTQDELKKAVAEAAIEYIKPKLKADEIIGIGTGSTANFFIDMLGEYKDLFRGAVSSSEASSERLRAQGIEVFDLNDVTELSVYVDGADEINHQLESTKGGGAALTREKIVAACSREFVCIADQSKLVDTLGAFPLPVEVIPMAREYVDREIRKLGGEPNHRANVITDNGGHILDVTGMQISDAPELEAKLDQITGVITNGLFAVAPASVLLLGTDSGVKTLYAK